MYIYIYIYIYIYTYIYIYIGDLEAAIDMSSRPPESLRAGWPASGAGATYNMI